MPAPPRATLFPYTTLFRSLRMRLTGPGPAGAWGPLIASLRNLHPRRGGILPELLGHLRRNRRADVRDRVLRELLHGLLDVHPVDAARVEPEDQLLVLVGDGLVAVALLDVFRDLAPPEGVDLPLLPPPPRRVAAPHDPVGAHVAHDLPQ